MEGSQLSTNNRDCCSGLANVIGVNNARACKLQVFGLVFCVVGVCTLLLQVSKILELPCE